MWRRIVRFVLILCGLAVGLGAEYWDGAPIPFGLLAAVRDEIVATFRSADTQWMTVVCMTVYLFGFAYLFRSAKPQVTSDQWERLRWTCLIVFVATALAWYGLKYWEGVLAEVPVLIGGMMLGQGAAFWQEWRRRKGDGWGIAPQVVSALVVLLAVAALWQPETARSHRYWTEVRWKGLWDNPNVYGMLMAVGLVVAVGQILLARRIIEPSTGGNAKAKYTLRTGRIVCWLRVTLPLAAAAVMGVGLVKSYSRGAWVAMVVGLTYLAWQRLRCPGSFLGGHAGKTEQFAAGNWLRRNWIPLATIVVALVVIAFWNYRHTEQPVVRRLFSSFNPNDFSWRNRVTTWEGALQMIADHPWWGVGWKQPLVYYDAFYRPHRLTDGRALWSNDYFVLGMTLGLPALACFLGYVALSLCRVSRVECRELAGRKAEDLPPGTGDLSLPAICRAGAMVLLVGFWFDGGFNGGLFTLATGATFWILLELGRES